MRFIKIKKLFWPKSPVLSLKVKYKIKPLLVKPSWFLSLKLENIFSKKIKIGFGPVETGEDDLSLRKWRIDPIVNYINQHSKEYVADIFFDFKNLSKFDIVVIVRNFEGLDKKIIKGLKENKTKLIYDIIDNPLGVKQSCYEDVSFFKSMDGVIISSPAQEKDIKKYVSNFILIEHPIINDGYKKSYKQDGEINIIWQGYFHNKKIIEKIRPVIEKIAQESHCKINLIYHTIFPYSDYFINNQGVVKYVYWNVKNSFKMLTQSDIGITTKDLKDKWEKRKPATKVITYMAAGLPVVCVPTEADKMVIQHGKTGYFAYSNEEWYKYLKQLVDSPQLREKIGKAGREYVINRFSVEKITRKYIDFFNILK